MAKHLSNKEQGALLAAKFAKRLKQQQQNTVYYSLAAFTLGVVLTLAFNEWGKQPQPTSQEQVQGSFNYEYGYGY